MTTIGYKNIPFVVDVTMHAAVHSNHYVNLHSNDPRLTFPSGGTSMTFTPANWNTPQHITVNFNGTGDAELLAAITNDYFVDGAGHHRVKNDIIDLSVTPLPADTWVGTTPEWYDGSGGDLFIAHNNLVAGHKADIGSTLVQGLVSDVPFFVNGGGNIFVDLPDGSHTTLSLSLGSGIIYTMALLGVYKFRMSMTPCLIQGGNLSGHVIQQQTFNYTITDAGGTVLIPTVTSATITSQGFSVANDNTGFSFNDTPRHADGPFSVTVPSAVLQNTFRQSVVFTGGGGITQGNCTGGAVNGSGTTVVISGTRVNFPFGVSCNRSAIEVHVGGFDTGLRFGAGYNN